MAPHHGINTHTAHPLSTGLPRHAEPETPAPRPCISNILELLLTGAKGRKLAVGDLGCSGLESRAEGLRG